MGEGRVLLAEEAARLAAAESSSSKSKSKSSKSSKSPSKSSCTALSDPIAAFNILATALGVLGLGVAGFQKHQKGQLTWRLAGLWTAGLGVAAGVEYAVSRWLYQKCPPKGKN